MFALSKLLLACGVLAPLLFIGTDLLAGTQWRGYSFVWKSISELSAVGAPTRSYAAPLFVTQNVLLLAFGIGVFGQAGQNTGARVIAVLLAASGIAGAAATTFFPTLVGIRPSPVSPNVIIGATAVILQLLAIGFGAAAFTNWFRFYSIGTLAVFAALTVLGLVAQSQARVGLQERVNAYGMLLWVGLLAIVLLAAQMSLGHGSRSLSR